MGGMRLEVRLGTGWFKLKTCWTRLGSPVPVCALVVGLFFSSHHQHLPRHPSIHPWTRPISFHIRIITKMQSRVYAVVTGRLQRFFWGENCYLTRRHPGCT